MTAATGGYVRQLATFTTESLAQLVGAPSHSRRAIAARRLSRDGTLLVAGCGLAILVLMLFVDVPTIGAMPRRGAASLWLVRILTDFARSGYVLQTTGALVLIIVFVVPLLQGVWRSLATALGVRISFIFMLSPYRISSPSVSKASSDAAVRSWVALPTRSTIRL